MTGVYMDDSFIGCLSSIRDEASALRVFAPMLRRVHTGNRLRSRCRCVIARRGTAPCAAWLERHLRNGGMYVDLSLLLSSRVVPYEEQDNARHKRDADDYGDCHDCV